MEYLFILSVVFLFTLYLDWKYRVRLYQSQKERLLIPLIFFIVGVIWDSYAVYRGHWSFQGFGLTGFKIGFLPLEEYLFFLIIPYFIITLYRVLQKKI